MNTKEVVFHTKEAGTIHELVSEVKAIQLALDMLASKEHSKFTLIQMVNRQSHRKSYQVLLKKYCKCRNKNIQPCALIYYVHLNTHFEKANNLKEVFQILP